MRWTSVDELSRTIDDLIGIHEQLARALGERCRVTDDHGLAPLLAGDSAQHAWHAALWRSRRPSGAGQANGAQHEPTHAAAGYGAKLDDLIDRVERLGATIDPATDAPTARTVELVLADLRGQRRRAVAHGLGDR